jgi:hypothetical protein
MLRCVILHLQGEHRITCSKLSSFFQCCFVFYVFITVTCCCVCYIGDVTEHKIHSIFRDLKSFLHWIKQHFVFVILYVKNLETIIKFLCLYYWFMLALHWCCYSTLCAIVTVYVHCFQLCLGSVGCPKKTPCPAFVPFLCLGWLSIWYFICIWLEYRRGVRRTRMHGTEKLQTTCKGFSQIGGSLKSCWISLIIFTFMVPCISNHKIE